MEIIKQHGTEIIVPLMNNTANIMKIGITQLTMRYLTKTNYSNWDGLSKSHAKKVWGPQDFEGPQTLFAWDLHSLWMQTL